MKKLTLILFVFTLILSGCDISDLNDNEKDPTDVPAEPLFSNAQVELGSFLHNTSVNVNVFKLFAQHWTTTTYTDEPRYDVATRAIPDNDWITIYRDVLIDLENARQLIQDNTVEAEAVKQNKLASIEVMKVLTYYHLVNIFGNVPYSEALNPDNPQPVYDDAETIYLDLLSRLNTAIDNYDNSSAGFGNADVYYNGDIQSWVKFANALKMRIGITIADSNSEVAQDAVESGAENTFTSNADNALIPFQSAPPFTNPVWQALVESGRDDYLPAAPLVNRMNEVEDPRRDVFFTQVDGEYIGGVYGNENQYSNFSHFTSLIEQVDRPGVILGYDEVRFILAEASARGYDVMGDAATHYEAAIRADLEYWDVSESEITTYLSQEDVAYVTADGDYRQKIGKQKWFALFLQGLQSWTEVRRLDSPDLETPEGAVVDQYPTRFTYPSDEQNLNSTNVDDAASAIGGDNLTTPLFWDVN